MAKHSPGMPPTAAQSRAKMQDRFDRARRWFALMQPILSKAPDLDPAIAATDDQTVGDYFIAWLAEMKNVRHYFGEWWGLTMGHPGEANKRMGAWRDKRLKKPEEATTWNLIADLRDTDVHREPVATARQDQVIGFSTAAGTYLCQISPYVVTPHGSTDLIRVQDTCDLAHGIVQRFIDDFDKPL